MKTIVASLFVILSIMAMPVHAGWESYTGYNIVMFETNTFLYTTYNDDTKRIDLKIPCDFGGYEHYFILELRNSGSFERIYENDFDNDLLIRFGKEPVYNISTLHKFGNGLVFQDDDFLSKIKKHQTLLVEIYLWSDEPVIAEFDISGFSEAVENHCG